ncbi:cytochrome P450 [Mycolicibacterium moriokaense]|uniref:Steroid C26-monooxygenase n=1 Tax=Mycolicibacterium moriokaense TaxID=39691 RepID=A0A318HEQ0_9MYCO|nr:cytochrome P450 [Mycolicibacterium moriokaense]PXX07257.1 cytochrome P450 [Mycolicibacterium moriokaense]
MAATEVLDLDLLDPSLYRNGMPHELYAELREVGPVLWHPRTHVPSYGRDIEFWAVLGHREIEQANRDWETFSVHDGTTIVPFPPERRGVMFVTKDPPEYNQIRRLISAGFTPRMVGRLEEQIQARTEQILDDAAARGELDFVPDIAYQLPMHVIADIVGISELDRPEVFRLTDLIMRATDPFQEIAADDQRKAEAALFTYAHELSAEKRRNPTDDVWSILATGELDEFELDLFFMALTFGGSETTRNALAQGLMALLDHRDQMAELRENPTLLPTAAEEVLRWSSPVICFGRTVTRDIELGAQQLRPGDRVGLFYPSANRDKEVFADPFRFDIHRSPNPHVAFGGGGPHFCLGASFARTELRVMIGALLRRFDVIEITGEPTWMSAGPAAAVGVAVQSLPVRLS